MGGRPDHASLETLDPSWRVLGNHQGIWEEEWYLHINQILPLLHRFPALGAEDTAESGEEGGQFGFL